MSRTTLLQERRMQTFQNVLGHWQARRLSALEAAEMLGMSERSFRRYRRRYEDDGLDGLFDRRLDKASARRVPCDQVAWVLEQYRTPPCGLGSCTNSSAKSSLKEGGHGMPGD